MSYPFSFITALYFITGLSILLLGISVLIREKASTVSRLFFLYTITTAIWLFSLFVSAFLKDEASIYKLIRVAQLGVNFIPATLFTFTLFLLKIQKERTWELASVWIISILFGAVFLWTDALFESIYDYRWGFYPKYGWFSIPFLAFFFIMAVIALRYYRMEYTQTEENSIRHLRARALAKAFGIGYLASIDFLPAFGIPIYPVGAVFMLALVLLTARSIWRYRLVDITPEFAANQIINTMGDALLVLDKEHRIGLVNNTCCSLFGFSAGDVIGKPVSLFIRDPVFRLELENFSLKKDIRNFEISYSKEGRALDLAFSASVMLDEAERPIAFICVGRDITERKLMEREFLKTRNLESLGILAGGIAHDFNNLLFSIFGSIGLAKVQTEREKILQNLRRAEQACNRAKGLTHQLLTFSKGGSPVRQVTSILDLLNETMDFSLRGSNVKGSISKPDELWAINVDSGQIGQVFQNLIINSIQAMPDGGMIKISCKNLIIGPETSLPVKAGPYVRLTVEDEGPGIPDQDLPRVFDPFFSTKPQGSGLGLSTVYSIIRRHDGHITVESKPGRGAVFHIYLPSLGKVVQGSEGNVWGSGTGELICGKGKVLFIDDEQMVRETAGGMLEKLGYEIVFARDGHEAIGLYLNALMAGSAFDLVITDLTIPGWMGGKEIVRKILELDPEAKVVVSSGYSNDPIISNYSGYGFRAFIPKPYKLEELGVLLSKILQDTPSAEIASCFKRRH